MLHFCTYFDRNYLPRGIALYESLRTHAGPFQLWVLCMDGATHEALGRAALPGIRPIALEEFERGDEALSRAKTDRTAIEYYFTCTASLPLYIFRVDPAVDLLTYLDADLWFFADPAPLFEELGRGSIGVIEHRVSRHLPSLDGYGRFNVGWISFRRDAGAMACLAWWRERCLEWCHDRVEAGRFAEQKYLDEWPARFDGVVVLRHPGANVAPWNVSDGPVRGDGERVRVGESPLLFFHFHGFKRIGRWLYDPNLSMYRARHSAVERRLLYGPYIRAVNQATRRIAPYLKGLELHEGIRKPLPEPAWRRALERTRRLLRVCYGIVTGRYIVAREAGLTRPATPAASARAPRSGDPSA